MNAVISDLLLWGVTRLYSTNRMCLTAYRDNGCFLHTTTTGYNVVLPINIVAYSIRGMTKLYKLHSEVIGVQNS